MCQYESERSGRSIGAWESYRNAEILSDFEFRPIDVYE